VPSTPLSFGSILVVDDDEDLREALLLTLADEGYSVMGVGSARAALAHLRDGKLPSLILLDMVMPDMDGWELRLELKKQRATAEIPIVLLSAHGNVRDAALALGAADYLRKPVRIENLLEIAGRYCRPLFLN
jgi:CheY-like chemotaxis protein